MLALPVIVRLTCNAILADGATAPIVAEDQLNDNKNRLVRTAISPQEPDFRLGKRLYTTVESNASFKVVLQRRRMLILPVVIVDDVTNGQVMECERLKVVHEHAGFVIQDHLTMLN